MSNAGPDASPRDPRPRGRRRVSRRRYAVRRAGALAVVVGLVAGVVWAVGALTGGDDTSVAQADRPVEGGEPSGSVPGSALDGSGVTIPGSTPDTGVGGDTGDTSDTGDTGDTPGAGDGGDGAVGTDDDRSDAGPPSADHPARVLIVGDSDAGTFGPYLQQLLRETGIVETQLDYKVSSGLARPDFYDWPAELDRIVPEAEPDIVVVTFGGNDAQFLADRSGASVVGQPRPDSDNAEWSAEYQRRAGAVMDQLAEGGRTVIWVGIPNHIDPAVTFRMQLQDDAVRAAVAERPEIRFVDTWNRFRGRNGNFAEYLVDPRDGQGKRVRAGDGFHLNQAGAEILAIDIAQVVVDELRAMGATI